MKREIKFRFLDKRFKGFLTFYPRPDGGLVEYKGQPYNSNDFRKIDISTIQQFTGLKDKNDKEIYEGDILEVSGSAYPNAFEVVWADGSVKYDTHLGFVLWRIDGKCQWNLSQNYPLTRKVIGNIFQNPELIK